MQVSCISGISQLMIGKGKQFQLDLKTNFFNKWLFYSQVKERESIIVHFIVFHSLLFIFSQCVIQHSKQSENRTLFISHYLLEVRPLSLVPKGATRSFNSPLTSCQATGRIPRAQGNSQSRSLNSSPENYGNSTTNKNCLHKILPEQ